MRASRRSFPSVGAWRHLGPSPPSATGENAAEFLRRHQAGDYGCVDDNDKKANDEAVRCGERVFSAYLLRDGVKVWVITEADRSSSVLLLPDEY